MSRHARPERTIGICQGCPVDDVDDKPLVEVAPDRWRCSRCASHGDQRQKEDRTLPSIAEGTVPVWLDYRDGNYSMTRADGSPRSAAPGLANARVPAWLLAQYEQHAERDRWWHSVCVAIDNAIARHTHPERYDDNDD